MPKLINYEHKKNIAYEYIQYRENKKETGMISVSFKVSL
jgi:hypothetical protein